MSFAQFRRMFLINLGTKKQIRTTVFNVYSRKASVSAVGVDNATGNESVKPFSEIPGPTGLYDLPYIGIAFNFKPFGSHKPENIHDVVEEMKKKYGDIFKMRFGKQYMVYIHNPDDMKTVFQQNYDSHRRLQPEIAAITAQRRNKPKGLAVLNGEEWLHRRKPTQEKMLRPAVVASYVPLLEKVTNDLVDKLRFNTETEDLLQDLTYYTIESVGMLCFNKRLGCLNAEGNNLSDIPYHVNELFEVVQKSVFSPMKGYMYFRTPMYKRFERATNGLAEVVTKEILAQRAFLARLKKEGRLEDYLETEPNFMYSLLADGRLNDDEINSIISDLFGAGIDSTANTLVFLLGHLALNPEKQEKLYKEIEQITESADVLTKEHIAKMSYLKACVKESMRRVHPTAFGSIRIPDEDMVVAGYQIPKDSLLVLNNRSLCMDERFFPRPNEFLPERWMRETTGDLAKCREHIFAHKPFGFGPRSCVGQRFAELELYISTVKIIQNFKISMPTEVKEIESHIRIFTAPVNKVKMMFTQRHK